MNGFEESLHELINMLVQYEITIEKFAPLVLMVEASTSKAKGKVTGREERKKDKASSNRCEHFECSCYTARRG
ncbi:UNVERIFIED_CONTAM: hypothetical protein Slati_3861800 [Sesamum latifolium]|uniref:Uncharacterized protein n=1 Tax=Sesamum latifolium TaxID=2727402 RepID=A0AAW2TLT0_9LAMI